MAFNSNLTPPVFASLPQDLFDQIKAQDTHKHSLDKSDRPYMSGALLVDEQNSYFIPLRSNKNARPQPRVAAARFPAPAPDRPKAALDFTNLIIVPDDVSYNFNRRRIDPAQYREINQNYDKIAAKLQWYISSYVDYQRTGKYPPFDNTGKIRVYPTIFNPAQVTLGLFHKQLGLDQDNGHKPQLGLPKENLFGMNQVNFNNRNSRGR